MSSNASVLISPETLRAYAIEETPEAILKIARDVVNAAGSAVHGEPVLKRFKFEGPGGSIGYIAHWEWTEGA